MARKLTLIAAFALMASSASADGLAGIWHSKQTQLVIHSEATGDFKGYPADMKSIAAISWYFYDLGEGRYRFWVIISGKGSEEKSKEYEIKVVDDKFTLPIGDAKGSPGGPIEFQRLFRPLAERVGDVQMRFRPRKDGEPSGRQYVLCALADLFEKAVADAKKVAPELRRINVCTTVGQRAPRTRPFARFERRGLAIDAINGVPLKDCGESLLESARAIKTGNPLPPQERRYAVYATALALCFIAQKGVEECHAPDLFGQASGMPYLERFMKDRGRKLPRPAVGPGWSERLELLRKQNGSSRFKGFLAVVAAAPEKRIAPKKSNAFEEKYDAPK